MPPSVGSVLAALGALSFISVIVFYPDATPREAYKSAGSVAAGVLATFGLVITVFSLLRWRTSLPTWAVLTAATGMFFTAANAWYFSTAINAAVNVTTDSRFEDLGDSPWFFATLAPKMALCLVGFVGLAVAGWRQRSIPRSAAVLLALAGLASAAFPAFPPGVLLSSVAFYLIAGSERRTGQAHESPHASVTPARAGR
jgi:hypothetical protein